MGLLQKVKHEVIRDLDRGGVSEKKKLEKNLDESWLHYEQLFNNLPVAFYTCDNDGNIIQYNEEAVHLWGKEPVHGIDRWVGWHKVFKDGRQLLPDETPMAIAVKEKR